MIRNAYFVSDLHIASPDDARAGLFLAFLKGLSGKSNASHLFLMGDIFDLWVADHRYFVDRYQAIVAEIERLVSEGVEVHYFEGNHDLHLRRFWQDQVGVKVHADSLHTRLGDIRLRLEHGDQMDPDDRGYRFLRWFLRTPPIRFLVCHLPGTLIAKIGDRASARSRVYTAETKTISKEDAVKKIRSHAQRAHEKEPFDLIVSGHVHVRDDASLNTKHGPLRSINLGSWIDAPCYLKIDDQGIRLVELASEGSAAPTAPQPLKVSAT